MLSDQTGLILPRATRLLHVNVIDGFAKLATSRISLPP